MMPAENSLPLSTGLQPGLWNDRETNFQSEDDLAAMAVALGADTVSSLSVKEVNLLRSIGPCKAIKKTILSDLRDLIQLGHDPLGEAFCTLRSPDVRRSHGATYTPRPIVEAMIDWSCSQQLPGRVVDPGVGSARFLMKAGKAFPAAALIGIDTDPLAALLARANLAVCGFADRSRVLVGDYRFFDELHSNPTLYIGNPPYVRHHQIAPEWKDWLFDEAVKCGHRASRLAGLHVHFFLAVARHARGGDFGAFITAAEWLDVNYGSLVRSLFLKELGGQSITVIEPTAELFADAATTGVITTFELGSKPASVFFRRIDSLRDLDGLHTGTKIDRARLESASRWSTLTRGADDRREGYVELGELCRVHRGQVTGSNQVWIAGAHSEDVPHSVLFPTVTRAREVFAAMGLLHDATKLRQVIDLPVDLDELNTPERLAVEHFLKRAKTMGADQGYIAIHRKAWWSVGLRAPAPIISTYMARRPPAFVMNTAHARHINIAHGLYPRLAMDTRAHKALVTYLQTGISQHSGRTYSGGLTKFEPREMERLLVPGPDLLHAGAIQ